MELTRPVSSGRQLHSADYNQLLSYHDECQGKCLVSVAFFLRCRFGSLLFSTCHFFKHSGSCIPMDLEPYSLPQM